MNKCIQLSDLVGDWAIVTGASSGIGREFAMQLAGAGMNLALVARRDILLHKLATDLEYHFNVRTLVLPGDLSLIGESARIRQKIEEHNIRIRFLVNNAAQARWASFEESSSNFYEQMIMANAGAVVSMCREFLPHLEVHSKSVVINVASPAALQPIPYMAVYAASKAFVYNFSLALYHEWRRRGIHVQTLLPGPTPGDFEGSHIRVGSTRLKPEQTVHKSLANLEQVLVCSGNRLVWQKLFALLPPKLLLHQLAKLFCPP